MTRMTAGRRPSERESMEIVELIDAGMPERAACRPALDQVWDNSLERSHRSRARPSGFANFYPSLLGEISWSGH